MLFTKPAVPGRVKTRLVSRSGGGVDADQAAALHAAFVGDLSEELLRGDFALRVAWDLQPGEQPEDSLLAAPVEGFEQRGDDLGERMFRALDRLACLHSAVAAIGSDHPTLDSEVVRVAFEALAEGDDVAIGPATDGGYYLIAVRAERLHRRLFEDVEWSTELVLGQTLERCRELGLRVRLLEAASDVDVPDDLEQLARELYELPVGRCRRTREWMRDWRRDTAATEGP